MSIELLVESHKNVVSRAMEYEGGSKTQAMESLGHQFSLSNTTWLKIFLCILYRYIAPQVSSCLAKTKFEHTLEYND